MAESDQTLARQQSLRLQRFYLAQLNYLITYIVIAVSWFTGQYPAAAGYALSHIVIGILCQGSIYLMLRSGFNLRFRDPSLTSLQIVIAMLLLTYLLLFTREFLSSLIMIYPIILLFGVFQLSRRTFVLHAGLALLLYGVLLSYLYWHSSTPLSLAALALDWFVLACFLGWLSFFCSYIRELRERLQRRHQTLQLHQETLKNMMGQLQTQADTDSLTGLVNRRYFIQEAERRITLLGPGQKLGLALIDLDHFKRINDLYGHAIGDEVLQAFAALARESLRNDDVIARFGGEEFILLLHKADLSSLQHCLERIRQGFAALCFSNLPEGVHCTLSAGMSMIAQGDDLEQHIHYADQAMYAAKALGRNRCEVHETSHA